jgi:hypothetical protein
MTVLQRRWLAAFLILGLIGTSFSFGQDKDKDKDKPKDKAPEVKKDDKKEKDKGKDEKKDKDKTPDKTPEKTPEKVDDKVGPVKLAWKFTKDKAFYQEMTTETKQTMKVMNQEITQNQKQTFYFSWTPKEEDKDKNWVIAQKIEGIKMDINIGGNPVTYDSTKDAGGTANPLADFFKALVGSEFKLTVNPTTGQVVKIEGREDFVKKLVSANQQMAPMLNQILSDDALKQMADPAFSVIPGKEVKPGDTWQRTSKLNMGPIGTYETKYDYTYKGRVEKLDKIDVKTTLTYTQPAENTQAQLPFKIEKADLKSSEGVGTILFDNDKGRLVSSDMSLKLAGKLTIKIGGTPTEVELNQEQKTTVKTSEENPISKKN